MAPRRRPSARKPALRPAPPRHAVVMVLGDVGRSPRMQYHALSLARMAPNMRVTLLGYAGENCVPDVTRQRNLELLTFTPHLQRLPRRLFLLLAPVKVLLQLLQLLWLLLVTAGSVDLVLLQNPPTIPTFVVVWLCCRLKGAKFVIDWHNLGYSLLALSLGGGHPLVKIAKWVERVFGRKADANLCVTHVMKTWLMDTWQIEATVLHDKPPLFFKPTSLDMQHKLFTRVGDQLEHCNEKSLQKRELALVDDTNTKVFCTCWGQLARATENEYQGHPIVLLGAKISDYMGSRSLNIGIGTTILCDPVISRSDDLRAWYAGLRGDHRFTPLE